jgi:signal transduction histidine kinase/CheY-like chemotaxis protein
MESRDRTAGWPLAKGEMAERIRSFDWRGTALGEPGTWPASLRNAVDLMLETAQPVYIGWGADLISLYNDACIPILGTRHPAGLGLPYRALFAEIWDEFRPLVAATLQGESQFFENRPIPLAGRTVPLGWFTFSFTPLRLPDGQVGGLYASIFENTRAIQAAQAARRATEMRYRTLFNSIDEGFCVVEVAFDAADNATDYRFLETNPAFEQLTGLQNATGKWMRDLQPLHEQSWFDVYGRVARSGQPSRFVEHTRTLDRWFNVFAFRVGPPAACQVAILFSDITERVEADKALRQADRRKDEFLATLAHELRNPLAPLRNGVQLARRAAQGNEVLRRTTDIMDRQLTHLVRLVDDLLDVGRVGSGKIELRRENLSLATVISASVEASRSAIEQRRHELIVEGDAAALTVLGDPHRLTQVFNNLISNACKYTPPGGRIRIVISRQGAEAVVRVIDNGIGIPLSHTSRVFELFSQVREHQPLHSGGLGIGLSLVRSLVQLHGGTVEAASEGPDRGSTFTVRLPLVEARQPSLPLQSQKPDSEVAPRRVLVADDNVDSAMTLAELLRVQGHEVCTAKDGEEAVAQARDFHPDAILLDLGMPRLDGIEAAKRIRSMAGSEQPLIVALTGWGQQSDRERTHAAGFDFHLVKPADPDEIMNIIGHRGAPRAPGTTH